MEKPQQPRDNSAAAPSGTSTDEDLRTIALDRTRLLEQRRLRGWSQAMAADRLGVSIDTLSKAENGVRIRLGSANVIAEAYGMRVADLCSDERLTNRATVDPSFTNPKAVSSSTDVYVYLKSIKLANEAATKLADAVLEGPEASPAGIYLRVSCAEEHIYRTIKHLSPIISSKPRHELKTTQHVYIEHTSAITYVEGVIGSINRAHRWEATDKGMYLALSLTEREAAALGAISSVKVFASPQHVIDEPMERVHKSMGWSTEGEDFSRSLEHIHSQDDFARMLVMVFEDVTLCELSLEDISRKDYPSNTNFVVTALVENGGEIHEGVGDPRIYLIARHYGTILSNLRGIPSVPKVEIKPLRTLDGIVIHVNYHW
jgi:transcriptional regulator with XRE-family HTH domain